MRKTGIGFLMILILVSFMLDGCTRVRTYVVEKDRVDQDLASGNAGYLSGTPKPEDLNSERKLTRQTYVAEIEVGSAPGRKKTKSAVQKSGAMTVETVQEPADSMAIEEPMTSAMGQATAVTAYVVQNNDTLQKISQKVYGSSKKWKKIFDANQDKLKSPDRIYAGQELKIPQE